MPYDLDASNGIARWVYRQTEEVGGLTWVRGKVFRVFSCSEGLLPPAVPDVPGMHLAPESILMGES